jgi:glycosyltransferase involved in cell wall biosynthesis
MTHPYSWPEVRRGAERICMETARSLAARGHDVTLFSAGDTASRTLQDGFLLVRYRRLFTEPLRHERWFAWRLLPALLAGRFDAVHSLMPRDCLMAIGTKRLRGHRTLYQEVGNPLRWWWDGLPDGRARRTVARRVDVYGCISQYSLDALRTDFGRDGALVPPGVRLDQFTPLAERATRPTILYSGALDEERKGVADLLAAAAQLVEAGHDLQVWLSGPGDGEPLLKAAPPAVRDRVELLPLGDPDALGRQYASAWVCALPSRGDSFGMVLVEALASGTPIVTSDDGAPQELVSPGVGAVAPAGDVVALAAALEEALRLAEDPATATRCREVAEAFGWDTMVAPTLEKLYAP